MELILNLLTSLCEAPTCKFWKQMYKFLVINMEFLYFIQAQMYWLIIYYIYIIAYYIYYIYIYNCIYMYYCKIIMTCELSQTRSYLKKCYAQLVTLESLTSTLMRLIDFQVNQGYSNSFTNWLWMQIGNSDISFFF